MLHTSSLFPHHPNKEFKAQQIYGAFSTVQSSPLHQSASLVIRPAPRSLQVWWVHRHMRSRMGIWLSVMAKQDLGCVGQQMGSFVMRIPGDWYHNKVKNKWKVCGRAVIDSILKRCSTQTHRETEVGWDECSSAGNSWSDSRRRPSGQLCSAH